MGFDYSQIQSNYKSLTEAIGETAKDTVAIAAQLVNHGQYLLAAKLILAHLILRHEDAVDISRWSAMQLAVTPEGYAAAVGSVVAQELTNEIDALFQQTGIFLNVGHVQLPSTNQ
jgi:hypothetical protein